MIALVGCGAAKLDRPAPARDMYTSSLFRMSFAYATSLCGASDTVYIVSAMHDLIEPSTVIKPYERSVAELGGKRFRMAWGARIAARIIDRHGREQPMVVLAGADYATPIVTGLKTHDGYRKVNRNGERVGELDVGRWEWTGYRGRIDEPLAGLKLGHRLAWLSKHLRMTEKR